jgi:cytochrome oxidase assembly protein ShyY1
VTWFSLAWILAGIVFVMIRQRAVAPKRHA